MSKKAINPPMKPKVKSPTDTRHFTPVWDLEKVVPYTGDQRYALASPYILLLATLD